MPDLIELTLESFSDKLGESFHVEMPDPAGSQLEVLTLQLTSAIALGGERRAPLTGAGRAPFSLLFQGPAAPMLPQRTYRMTHDALGALDLFIVPVGADQDGARYEAIFN